MSGCQYIGADIDPRKVLGRVPMCGHKTLEGKAYCGDHYWVVYKKGSSTLKSNTKAIEAEIKDIELQKLIAEQEADMENDYV
jgi:hypothetical protein